MSINATLIIQMIVFFIGAFVTMKFIWPPLVQSLDERRKKIADGLSAAEKSALALAEATAKSEQELKQARAQAQDILAAANKQGAQLVELAKATAETEKARIIESGHEEVMRELNHAKEALRKEVADLAVMGAARILRRELDASKHADVLSDLAARI